MLKNKVFPYANDGFSSTSLPLVRSGRDESDAFTQHLAMLQLPLSPATTNFCLPLLYPSAPCLHVYIVSGWVVG
jgi:hypothetical protein